MSIPPGFLPLSPFLHDPSREQNLKTTEEVERKLDEESGDLGSSLFLWVIHLVSPSHTLIA